MRWIRTRRRVYIDVQALANVDSRWIAVSIGVVVRRTTGRNLGPFRRLGKLPYVSEGNGGVSGTRRSFRKRAPRRRRTGIVRDPEYDFSCAGILTDVASSHNIFAAFFCSGNARTVNARPEAACRDSVYPAVDIRFLLCQHPSALLLIQEDDGSRGKSFPTRRGHSRLRIGLAKFARIRNRPQLIEQTAVEQHQESESGRLQYAPFAAPCISARAGRCVQPIARVRKSLTKNLQVLVARIIIPVEAEVRGRICRIRLRVGGWNSHRSHQGERQRDSFHVDDVIAPAQLRSPAQR